MPTILIIYMKGDEKMFELVIIWSSGEKDIFPYATRERAEEIEEGYKMAFGLQVAWSCVRPLREGSMMFAGKKIYADTDSVKKGELK